MEEKLAMVQSRREGHVEGRKRNAQEENRRLVTFKNEEKVLHGLQRRVNEMVRREEE